MSAPETNLESQKKRHKPLIVGIGFAVAAVIVIIAVVSAWPFGPS